MVRVRSLSATSIACARSSCLRTVARLPPATPAGRRAGTKLSFSSTSDDMLASAAASTVARIWRPGISKLQWCLAVVDIEGRPVGNVFPKYREGFTAENARQQLLFATNYLTAPTSGNAYARELLKAGSPIEGHRAIDAILNTIAPLYGDVVTVHSVLSYYRVHHSNASLFTNIAPSRFRYYLEFERARITCLQRHCQKLGVVFDAKGARERFAWCQECEVMLGKLAPEAPMNGARLAARARQAVRAILSASDQSGSQRALRALWLILVASTPRSWARHLIGMRYMPTSWPGFVEKLSRGFRRPPALSAPSPALFSLTSA